MASSEEKLKKLLENIAKEQNYLQSRININRITSDGANYTTDLYLATISEPRKPDLDLFAKVANIDKQAREQNSMLANVYAIESMFYTELAVNYERLYQKNNVPVEQRLVISKFFGQNLTPMEEILVLENLEAKGYRNFDRMKTFNWEYADTAVQQMARFHALGMALKDENPAVFESTISRMKVDLMANQNMMEIFLKQAVKNGCEAVSNKEHADRLVKFFSSGIFSEMMTFFMADKTMLIHGDFRPSNLMHRRRNGNLEIIPLDFQTVRLGNPVGDLMHFIFSGSDEEFRRLHYERLLDHYHRELTIALQHLRVDVEKVYPKNTFKEDVLRAQPLGLILGLVMTVIVTVSPEDAPKIGGNLDDLAINPNQLAQERINGIVRDFVRWRVI